MDSQSKKFHFQEINWVICFPTCGNAGKYNNYLVTVTERKHGEPQTAKSQKLGDVLSSQEIDQGFPHTVGYYKGSSGEGADFKSQYLEIREIKTVEEFWAFLNALNL